MKMGKTYRSMIVNNIHMGNMRLLRNYPRKRLSWASDNFLIQLAKSTRTSTLMQDE